MAYSPAAAEGEGVTTFNEVRYQRNYGNAATYDPECLDDTGGTITITGAGDAVGDEIVGTFDGFGPFTGDPACTVQTMSGPFTVTREADDLY